jgi:hypothetical protein
MKGFFRNVFIIKTEILIDMIHFMNKAMDIAINNENIKKLLSADSHYNEGSAEVAMKIFGTKYYQLFPFIFERLPSFYLHNINANICHNSSGPCQYNT